MWFVYKLGKLTFVLYSCLGFLAIMMSFTLIIFGSLFCLSQCFPMDSLIPPVPEVTVPNYQNHIEGFMKEMSVAAEKHLQPLMADLDQNDQQQVVEFGINSFINYIDYVLHVINGNEDAKIMQKIADQDDDDDKEDYNDDDFPKGPIRASMWSK